MKALSYLLIFGLGFVVAYLVFHRFTITTGANGGLIYRFDHLTGKTWESAYGRPRWVEVDEPMSADEFLGHSTPGQDVFDRAASLSKSVPRDSNGFELVSPQAKIGGTHGPWEDYQTNSIPPPPPGFVVDPPITDHFGGVLVQTNTP